MDLRRYAVENVLPSWYTPAGQCHNLGDSLMQGIAGNPPARPFGDEIVHYIRTGQVPNWYTIQAVDKCQNVGDSILDGIKGNPPHYPDEAYDMGAAAPPIGAPPVVVPPPVIVPPPPVVGKVPPPVVKVPPPPVVKAPPVVIARATATAVYKKPVLEEETDDVDLPKIEICRLNLGRVYRNTEYYEQYCEAVLKTLVRGMKQKEVAGGSGDIVDRLNQFCDTLGLISGPEYVYNPLLRVREIRNVDKYLDEASLTQLLGLKKK